MQIHVSNANTSEPNYALDEYRMVISFLQLSPNYCSALHCFLQRGNEERGKGLSFREGGEKEGIYYIVGECVCGFNTNAKRNYN